MLKSMTGYGDAFYEDDNYKIKIEVKSINSKNLDLSFYFPKYLTSYEYIWRNYVSTIFKRGKINLLINLDIKSNISSSLTSINKEFFKSNYDFLNNLSHFVGKKNCDLFSLALKYSIDNYNKEIDFENLNFDLEKLNKLVENAIHQCDVSRQKEGEHLEKNFENYINNIHINFAKIIEKLPERTSKLRTRLEKRFSEFNFKDLDKNRFEQEILYYLERLDIEEEIIRLEKHLNNFTQIMKNDESYCGKKLNFVLQEIGREVNTIGSKANDLDIQNNVILIKEETEKIREQLQNIL